MWRGGHAPSAERVMAASAPGGGGGGVSEGSGGLRLEGEIKPRSAV